MRPRPDSKLIRSMQLVGAELPFLRRTLARHAIPDADVEDVAQDTILVAARRWSDYDPSRPLRPWLLGIALRVAHDHRRRRRELLVDADSAAPLLSPEEELEARRERDRVAEALASLPDKFRIPVVMYEIQGLSLKQMADRWSVSVSVASARLQAGRRALARTLRRERALGPDRRRLYLLVAVAVVAVIASCLALWRRASSVAAVARASRPLVAPVLARWSFDDPANLLRDSSGHGHECLPQKLGAGPLGTAGMRGGALALAGVGWLECPRSEWLRHDAITIAAWAQPKPKRGVQTILTRQLAGDERDDLFLAFNGDKVMFNSDSRQQRLEHFVSLAPARWIHVAVTLDDHAARLFLDGALVEETRRGGRGEASGGPLLIGAGDNGAGVGVQRFVGALDELVIFAGALSPAEIAHLAAR